MLKSRYNIVNKGFYRMSRVFSNILIGVISILICISGSISNVYALDNSFIFKDSDRVKITEEELQNMDSGKYEYARNEIFARKGHIFSNSKFKTYFSTKSWYKPKKQVSMKDLNAVEEYNVKLIKFFEDKLKFVYRDATSTVLKYETFKENKKIQYDLNGDGKKDVIQYRRTSDGFILSVNNKSVSSSYYNLADSFAIVDMDKKDKYKEIIISDYGPSDDSESAFYFYNGKDIIYMGTTGALFEGGLKIDGSGEFWAESRGQILQTWFFDKLYTLSKSHKITRVQVNMYKTQDFPVFLKHSLKLYTNQNSRKQYFTLGEGETVKIIGTDDEKWCLIQCPNGKKGYIEIKDFSFVMNENLDAREIFAGLCYAD
jgi:hypothetical protein